MPFPTDDILLGAPSYGRRKGTEGVIWHTTEGTNASRTAAVATARWQATPGTTTGSYAWIIYDGGLLLTVPYLEASGGVNPGSSAWAPHRYPFLKQQLSAAAYADPNAYLVNIAFSGKTAVFRDVGIPDNMIATARRLVEWLEDLFGRSMVQSGHLMYQTNRSDPSMRVLSLISGIPEGPVADIDTFKLETIRIDANANIRSAPADSASLLFKTASASTAVSVGTKNGYHAYWIESRKAWAYTSTQHNVLSAVPYQNTVEVIKEVPTGITQAQLDAARTSGAAAGFGGAKAQAIVAAENHLATVRAMK